MMRARGAAACSPARCWPWLFSQSKSRCSRSFRSPRCCSRSSAAAAVFERPLAITALVLSLVPLALYSPYVAAHAEWHWASGIMKLHIIPSFIGAFTSLHRFERKAIDFAKALRMLATTMAGPIGLLLLIGGFCIKLRSRADAILWGWLAGGFNLRLHCGDGRTRRLLFVSAVAARCARRGKSDRPRVRALRHDGQCPDGNDRCPGGALVDRALRGPP